MFRVSSTEDVEGRELDGLFYGEDQCFHLESEAAGYGAAMAACPECFAELSWDGVQWEGDHEYDCEADEPPAPPLMDEINGCHVFVEQNQVTVTISVGDPRGGFAMRVERINGELRLSVPTPEDRMPHMRLEPLASPGYYRIKPYNG